MATNDHSEASGAADPPAKDLTDDVKRLLDQLAGQITDADQRHSDSVQDMQVRLAALSDRAAAAKPDLPDDSAAALGRVEAAMVALADRLADAEPATPHVEPAPAETGSVLPDNVLPDEVRAELRRAISEGHRERYPAAETPPASRYPYVGLHAAAQPDVPPSPSATPAIERAWLEDRFADIADRVEKSMARLDRHNSFETITARFDQLEQRFAVVLDSAPTRGGPDAGTLQGIEKQITGLFAELDRTQTQLGRLDTIESRLTELRGDPSDEQLGRLIRAVSPTDAQLSAVAMAAAEHVAERIRGIVPANAANSASEAAAPGMALASPGADPRLGELTVLMQEFISEYRTGDAQTAEALDTMQQAMQHLIDRVEAIEAAQITGHDELMRATQAMPARRPDGRHEPLDFGFREQDLRPAAGAVGTDELPSLAVVGPGAALSVDGAQADPHLAPPAPDHGDNVRHRATTHDSKTDAPSATPPHHAPSPGAPLAAGEPHREAFIAMARRAAAKAAREPSPPADDIAMNRPTGAFGWVRQLAASRSAGGTAGAARRPRILLVASFAAFLLAGFWMLAGSGLRGIIPGIGSAQPISPAKPTRVGDARPTVDTPALQTPSPQPLRNSRFPGLGRVVEGGYGITIDEGPGRTAPEAPLKAREKVQLASLADATAPDEARSAVAAPGPAPRPSPMTPNAPLPGPSTSGPVEMPSAMIGPLSLRHAAANGDPIAQLEVGVRFAEAKGVPQDFAQAATWYQRAAAQGHANAQFRLGALYERGLGVAADPARARVWYGRAAEQGNVRAMHNLAVFSAGKPGSTTDYPSAVQWFTEAANRGLADSQYNLGVLYETGRGVPASTVEAYKWYALAARSGDKGATQRRDALREKLDPTSVSAVDTLIIKWRAQPLDPAANDARAAVPGG
jgi:localization factor PodJL